MVILLFVIDFKLESVGLMLNRIRNNDNGLIDSSG